MCITFLNLLKLLLKLLIKKHKKIKCVLCIDLSWCFFRNTKTIIRETNNSEESHPELWNPCHSPSLDISKRSACSSVRYSDPLFHGCSRQKWTAEGRWCLATAGWRRRGHERSLGVRIIHTFLHLERRGSICPISISKTPEPR